ENQRKYPTVKENVPGDFYVEERCCTMCGVPHAEAPALFGGFDSNGKATHEQCFVKKQPETGEELNQMINAIAAQELICIRYSGSDRNIKAKIIEVGEVRQIDWKE
ncbi:MAG TPA: hypothetical protein VF646_04920, partial [Cytophagales bacterium]